ncbi:MAG TPA: hypothetical protein VMS17_11835 [Gemmataceae bacterium]|nr:hypothetical protein [Gemmataceae bacterium]
MPSASLLRWQNDRRARLAEMDAHCAAAAALAPPRPLLAEEGLRAYAMLLSGHFQGFCRDLYTESSQIIVAQVAAHLQGAVQMQFSAELKINSSNPTVETIRKDFERFGFTLDFHADQANGPRVTHLGEMNKWRNAIAHQRPTAPPGVPPLTLAGVQAWRVSCDGLAAWLDGILYNELRRILGVAPW